MTPEYRTRISDAVRRRLPEPDRKSVAVSLLLLLAVIVGAFHVGIGDYERRFEERAYTVQDSVRISSLNGTSPPVMERHGDECRLLRPIVVAGSGSLTVDGDRCSGLNMLRGTGILVQGTARFNDVDVQSYNPATDRPIRGGDVWDLTRRPFIETESRWNQGAEYVEAVNSTFSYLGYERPVSLYAEHGRTESRWGFALYDMDGARIVNSTFHHNYYGFYTWNATNIDIINSTAYHNINYGFDFHDYSHNITIIESTAFANENHAIIFSRYNRDNRIVNNTVYDHDRDTGVFGLSSSPDSGIVLDYHSHRNLVAGNTLINNTVAIHLLRQSKQNVVRENIIGSPDGVGDRIEIESGSDNNTVVNNTLAGIPSDPILIRNAAGNRVAGNKLADEQSDNIPAALRPYVK